MDIGFFLGNKCETVGCSKLLGEFFVIVGNCFIFFPFIPHLVTVPTAVGF